MIVESVIDPTTNIWQPDLVNIYKSIIDENCNIGAFVEIGRSIIGKNCKIQAHSFICTARIKDNVFIGPRVTFTNVKFPNATMDGNFESIIVEDDVTIGAGSIILPGIILGRGCFVGAGSVVTKNVEPFAMVFGNPARKKEI